MPEVMLRCNLEISVSVMPIMEGEVSMSMNRLRGFCGRSTFFHDEIADPLGF
jgi:hypothetical protein